MVALVQPRLVNEPFSEAGILLDFRFGGRAILFDLGDVSRLSSREILRVTHIFVSHRHMDHFAGFDQVLRLCLYRHMRLTIIGPEGLCDAVEAKLGAYQWNLLDETSHDFSILACDWRDGAFGAASLFAARSAFRRSGATPPSCCGNLLLDEPEFLVETATLDHGLPCLAFAFQEKMRVNVHKARLDEMGLPVGRWLTEAKRMLRHGADGETIFEPGAGMIVKLDDLLEAGVLRTGKGQRIVYATDLAHTDANVDAVVGLARDADEIFIEAGFLDEDSGIAAIKKHLTAAQAGRIAGLAGARRAVPMHFSPRYLGREADLVTEFQDGFARAKAATRSGEL